VPAAVLPVPQPASLSGGLCVTSPDVRFWTSDALAERQAAAEACLGCRVLSECASWAISQPVAQGGAVLGGMTASQQQKRRTAMLRARREAQAARQQHRRELQRGYTRRAERLRRALGLAESPEHQRERYQRDPEPQKARSAAYYAEHKEAILKARREARRQKAPAA
jgi:hypothetical protein